MRVSASRVELLDFCQAFPRFKWDGDPPGEAALTGSAFHSLVEQALGGGEPEFKEGADVVRAKKLFATWQIWWPTYAAGRKFEPEVALIYDARTGAVRRVDREWVKGDRKRGDYEIPVIIDALHVDGSRATVLDFKSGKKLGPAASNGQLMLGALAVHRAYNASNVRVGLVYPGVRKMRGVDEAEHTLLDLLEYEARLKSLVEKIPTAEPYPGDWCFRCPARKGGCPKMKPADDSAWWEAMSDVGRFEPCDASWELGC